MQAATRRSCLVSGKMGKKGEERHNPVVATVVLEGIRKDFNLVKGRRKKRLSLVPRKVERALPS